MKIYSVKSGLTLTELIVATLVIGVVMLGVASVDIALRQTHKGASQKSLAVMQNSMMMLRISKDAQIATGDGTNFGIVTNSPTDDIVWIRKENPANPAPDPSTYADDIWVSYTFDPATFTLYHCTVPSSGTPCTVADEAVGQLASFNATVALDEATQALYLQITLVNRLDPTTAADSFDNPEYTLTSRIYPMSASF